MVYSPILIIIRNIRSVLGIKEFAISVFGVHDSGHRVLESNGTTWKRWRPTHGTSVTRYTLPGYSAARFERDHVGIRGKIVHRFSDR